MFYQSYWRWSNIFRNNLLNWTSRKTMFRNSYKNTNIGSTTLFSSVKLPESSLVHFKLTWFYCTLVLHTLMSIPDPADKCKKLHDAQFYTGDSGNPPGRQWQLPMCCEQQYHWGKQKQSGRGTLRDWGNPKLVIFRFNSSISPTTYLPSGLFTYLISNSYHTNLTMFVLRRSWR